MVCLEFVSCPSGLRGKFLAFTSRFDFLCAYLLSVVFYLFIELVGCSVDSRISRGARKLTRTSRVIYKKKRYTVCEGITLTLYYFSSIDLMDFNLFCFGTPRFVPPFKNYKFLFWMT
jgi:hypothetical protein